MREVNPAYLKFEVPSMSKLSIKQVELRVSQTLQSPIRAALRESGYFVPERYRLEVSLVDAHGRKKRSTAGADNWSPDSGGLQLWFAPIDTASTDVASAGVRFPSSTESHHATAAQAPSEGVPIATTNVEPGLAVVVRALARAETTPGWSFVSLKKFRDEILPGEGVELSPIDQRHFLGYAINEKLITTNRVANPKDPRFPVTTIRLNRLNKEVQRILGEPASKSPGFAPIHIKEPLSATILRERR
jgi:hypothetical protein